MSIELAPSLLTPITDFYSALPKQLAFHQSMCPYRLNVGGFGSGKTLALLMEAVITCLMVPSSNSLIIRTTSPDLQKTVINKFLNPKIVPRHVYKTYNKNEKVAYFHNGSQLHFGYCHHEDDINQFLSTEYVFIGLEEAGEFSYRVFEALSGRLRLSIDVKDINGNKVLPSIGLSTNPFGNGWPWIKRLFKTKMPMKGMGRYDPSEYFRIKSTVVDNPFVYTPEYVAKLEGMTGTLREQALFGNEDVVGGQYYPQFNTGQHEGIHVMDAKDIKFANWQPIWIGSDWDSAHWPVIWFTKAQIPDKINGGWRTVTVAFRELILEDVNALDAADAIAKASHTTMHPFEMDELGQRIKKIKEPLKYFYFSWDRFKRHGGDHTIAQELGDRLVKWGRCRPTQALSSRVDGWVLISQLFDMDELVVTTDCPKLIEAIPTLIRDTPDVPEDVRKADTIEDDIADAFRYGVMSYMKERNTPQSVKDAEVLAGIKDPVAQRIRSYEMWASKQGSQRMERDSRLLPWQIRK